jgi:hypothetical protein
MTDAPNITTAKPNRPPWAALARRLAGGKLQYEAR